MQLDHGKASFDAAEIVEICYGLVGMVAQK
jgi:hypothetical protein